MYTKSNKKANATATTQLQTTTHKPTDRELDPQLCAPRCSFLVGKASFRSNLHRRYLVMALVLGCSRLLSVLVLWGSRLPLELPAELPPMRWLPPQLPPMRWRRVLPLELWWRRVLPLELRWRRPRISLLVGSRSTWIPRSLLQVMLKSRSLLTPSTCAHAAPRAIVPPALSHNGGTLSDDDMLD